MMANQIQVRRPRDGKAFQALLVGGWPQTYQKMQEVLLESFGVALVTHWPTSLSIAQVRSRQLPRGCELVVVLAEMIKTSARYVGDAARTAGIPIAIVGVRQGEWISGLQTAGFALNPPWRTVTAPPAPSTARPAGVIPIPPPRPACATGEFEVTLPDRPSIRESHPLVRVVDPITVGDVEFVPAPTIAESMAEAAAMRREELAGRYVRVTSKAWTDDHASKLIALADTGITDAVEFCDRLAKETGVYRSPGSVGIRLSALAVVCSKLDRALLTNITAAANALTVAKRAAAKAEAAAMKRGGMDALGEWISVEMATQLVGGRRKRLDGTVDMYVDKTTSGHVVRRDDVVALRARLLERTGGDEAALRGRLNPPSLVPDGAVIAKIVKVVTDAPGIAMGRAAEAANITAERLERLLNRMDDVMVVPHATRGADVRCLAIVGWAEPAVPRRPAPEDTGRRGDVHDGAPMSIEPAAVPAPSMTAEIYRAIRAKEISPEDGARMLKELAK